MESIRSNRHPKLLVVSRSEWSDENSVGSTLTNFFGDWPIDDIANLSFRAGRPNNNVCHKYFLLTEVGLIKGNGEYEIAAYEEACFSVSTNCDASFEKKDRKSSAVEKKLVELFRGKSIYIVNILQSFFWMLGWWKRRSLYRFLRKFDVDVIFFPAFHAPYTHLVIRHIAKLTGAKLIIFHADDYLCKDVSEFGFFKRYYWNWSKREILNSIGMADLNYCITDLQATEYHKKTGSVFSVLHKGASVADEKKSTRNNEYSQPGQLRMVYAGSLEHGRWKTVKLLSKAVEKLNEKGAKIHLDIFSQYSISEEVRCGIESKGASSFHGAISSSELKNVVASSDIVLHVESFDPVDMQDVKFSFSTKIVDCLASGTCLMAVGPEGVASIEYLKETRAAIVVDSPEDIGDAIFGCYSDRNYLVGVRNKAREYCERYIDISQVRSRLYLDIFDVLK